MAVHVRRLTYTDLESLPEDGKKYELHDGEVFVSAAPRIDHQRVVRNIETLLVQHLGESDLGEVLPGVDVYFAEDTVYNPDICFVSSPNAARVEDKFVRGAPDIAIEVLSPTTAVRDIGIKLQGYARYGVREYWLIDAEQRTAEVFTLQGAAFELRGRFTEYDVLTSEVLPDLRMPLRQIWPRTRKSTR